MPFYAKDWRSPGESWIRTEDGWEKLKVLETNKVRNGTSAENLTRPADDDKENRQRHKAGIGLIPPHCRITLKCTKEIAGFNGLSDALHRLDFRSAVHDHRRFPYTVKLLELLLSHHRITNLSGCAQKSVLNVLEEIAVKANNQNVHVLVKLLGEVRQIIRGDSWWGQPLGSSQLWGKHVQTIDRIGAMASNASQLEAGVNYSAKSRFEDLPEVCVREILFRLADYKDLMAASEASSVAQKLSAEQQLWKRLCRYHFSPVQITFTLKETEKDKQKEIQTLNKTVRNVRASHPYLNSPRSSPVRNPHENDARRQQILDNFKKNPERDLSDVQDVDSEIGSHLDHRIFYENGNDDTENNSNKLVSFQDVRNHFDRQQSWNVGATPSRHYPLNKRYNYNEKKISYLTSSETDWEDVFHRARRLFGLREEYPEVLYLCRNCRCLFWKTFGHPCIEKSSLLEFTSEQQHLENLYIPIPPHAFLKFFSL